MFLPTLDQEDAGDGGSSRGNSRLSPFRAARATPGDRVGQGGARSHQEEAGRPPRRASEGETHPAAQVAAVRREVCRVPDHPGQGSQRVWAQSLYFLANESILNVIFPISSLVPHQTNSLSIHRPLQRPQESFAPSLFALLSLPPECQPLRLLRSVLEAKSEAALAEIWCRWAKGDRVMGRLGSGIDTLEGEIYYLERD